MGLGSAFEHSAGTAEKAAPVRIGARPLPLLEPAAPLAVSAAASDLSAQAHGPRSIAFVRTLRISVTDRCNFRCIYCMPEEGVEFMAREELLTYEEIQTVARAAIHLGITDFKLTGGEPLLRQDLPTLVRMLREIPGCGEISLSTNGLLLERAARDLGAAGVDRITVSVDTLDPARFRAITRTGDLQRVLDGIALADQIGMGPVKINVVVMRDHNLDEVEQFAKWTIESPRTVRFIEFMPLGRSRVLIEAEQFVAFDVIRRRIEAACGPLVPADADVGNGPARVFRLAGAKGRVGFIHAMSAPFCATCNRLRLTPEGQLRSCLFDGGEVDVRRFLRPHVDRPRLEQAFIDCVVLKPDQHMRYGERAMSSIGG
ncbi:MAG: GTP 3',8-cyclase MoaA [Planctomycetes bacterium]|nr:GTP 3',8-cyclase MoaA [Planctomycetota bacterium]